jgi:periplasmic divalent cation tolerance protein
MAGDPAHRVVLCTCPDEEVARQIATTLVEEDLAACVNVLPGVQSIYRWKGGVEHDAETLLIIKTTAQRYPALETRVQALHPYELPEIIAVPIAAGLQGYLDWLERPE